MKYTVTLTPEAVDDLDYFTAYEQRIIMSAIREFLREDAHIITKRRKYLQENAIASWELKRDIYRIFYDIVESQVDILAIGYKDHNDLFFRGKKVEL